MLCRRLLQHADRTNDQGPNWLGHWLVTLPYPTLPYPNTADVRGTIPLDRKGHGHLRLFTIVCTILFFSLPSPASPATLQAPNPMQTPMHSKY